MKRGIVAYQNRKVIERDEEGSERALAIKRLRSHREFQTHVFGN